MRDFEGVRDDLQIAEMDREHKLLQGLIELLYARNRAGAGYLELMDLLRELEARTLQHFRNEELYLASIDYSALEPHRRVHRHLLDQLVRHRSTYCKVQGPLPFALVAFLRDWLSAHIFDSHHNPGFCAHEAPRSDRWLSAAPQPTGALRAKR